MLSCGEICDEEACAEVCGEMSGEAIEEDESADVDFCDLDELFVGCGRSDFLMSKLFLLKILFSSFVGKCFEMNGILFVCLTIIIVN